jgi:hypothetical protein
MKENVLAEILEWSKALPEWQRDALRRVFVTGSTTADDVRELAELCKAAHGLSSAKAADPLTENHMQIPGPSAGPVTLAALTHVAGVNALAPNQTITFGPQLTIVYGNNGAGKSGYTRVLKAACRARAAEAILGNVVSSGVPLKAKANIRFVVGSAETAYPWEATAPREPSLGAVSVFDSLSAPVYLKDKTDVAFRPFGLDVFDRLSTACNDVRARLDGERQQLAAVPSAVITLSEGTKARALVDGLTALTNVEDVNKFAELSQEELGRLKTLQELELDARATDPKRRSRELGQRSARLIASTEHLEAIYSAFSSPSIEKVRRLSGEVAGARKALAELRTATLSGDLLVGTGEPVWKALWDAAIAFASATSGPPVFPALAQGSRCPLCQEILPPDAKARIKHLAEFAASRVQVTLTSAEAGLETAMAALRLSVDRADVTLAIDELAADDPQLAERVREAMSVAAQVQLGLSVSVTTKVPALPASPATALRRVAEGYTERAKQLSSEGSAMTAAQTAELKELVARQNLATQLEQVKDTIERKKRLAVYGQCIAEASTTGITRKSTALTKQLVTDKLRAAFQGELASLQFTHVSVEIRAAGGSRGTFYHQLVFANAPTVSVTTVLSEGESRTLSLAAFLTELSTAPTRSTIIFDDPVSSLDHIWRERIASRLVAEAKTRQVIVFTHDLLFLRLLVDGAKREAIDCFNQYLTRIDENKAGVSSADLPWVAMNVKERLGWLNNHWQAADKHARNSEVDAFQKDAAYILGRLREAWEQGVSEVLLNGVVERFRLAIETRKVDPLHDITQADCDQVESGMTFCSRWMAGHDAAAADGAPFPTSAEIKKRIDDFGTWVDAIRKRRTK